MMLSVLPVGAFAAEPGAAEPENGVSAQADAAVPEGYIAINEKNFPDEILETMWRKNGIKITTSISAQVRSRAQSGFLVIIKK